MRKSFFFSIIALAAVVSCSKSEVIDTKYGNDTIGFENYVGRDAVTKATPFGPESKPTQVGVYGFYTGADVWGTDSRANLWANLAVNADGTYDEDKVKYWTNETDNYTFLAYAPYSVTGTNTYGTGSLVVPTGDNVTNPTLTYTVPSALADQQDVLYASVTTQKTPKVELAFHHALSRITVKASENNDDFNYTVYGLKLTGNFVTKNVLNLKEGTWGVAEAAENTIYTIKEYKTTGEGDAIKPTEGQLVPTPAPATEQKEEVKPHDFAGTNNYLMVIPTPTTEGATTTVELEVIYTTTYDNQESNPMTKTLEIPVTFVKGKAYSFDLVFAPNTTDAIQFTVTVDDWGTEDALLKDAGEDKNDNPVDWNKPTTGGGDAETTAA